MGKPGSAIHPRFDLRISRECGVGDPDDEGHVAGAPAQQGAHTAHANPDRLSAVNDEITSFGCEVTAQYALLGRYDFATVIEAPDNETIAHLSVDLASRGAAKFEARPAIEVSSLVHKLKSGEQLGR